MVPPPKLVHAVEFHNATPGEVTVRVAYDDHKDKVGGCLPWPGSATLRPLTRAP